MYIGEEMPLVLAVTIPSMVRSDEFKLSDASRNVTVSYAETVPSDGGWSFSLAYNYTEEEIFSLPDTDILRGTVTQVRNIEITFQSDDAVRTEYRCIARIKVTEVYRGECKPGQTVTVLMPFPYLAETDSFYEDSLISSNMEQGAEGIFLLTKHGADDYLERPEGKLFLEDIAEYYFPDGERFGFVETSNGLVFSRDTYSSVAKANSLDEIEKYVKKMLKG